MSLFGKKKEVVDWSDKYKGDPNLIVPGGESDETTWSAEERRRRLAKRLSDMTDKLEDISTKIYHLQQRLEVLEKKANINRE